MKLKFTLLAAFIVFCFTVKAQTQLQNGGFEMWSQSTNPDGWGDWESISPLVPNHFTFKDNSHVEGNYSVQLVTDTASLPGTPGLLLAGILSAGSASLSSTGTYQPAVVAFTGRPDTLFFSYKYTTQSTDTATITIALGSNDTTIMQSTFILDTTSKWLNEYALLAPYYLNNHNPQGIVLTFSSSFRAPVIGSTFNIDAVHFGYNTSASGVKDIKDEIGLKVYPNPASTTLNIRADKNLAGSNVQIYNMNGQVVTNKVLEGNANTLDLSNYSCGTYIYKITDKQNNVIDENKVSVIK